ncbi:MAG TPA: hypothetical protein VGL97_00555 [Bryobacteraceae bacterium]|jgi:hypothetical protein
MKPMIWYASYGSNLLAARFQCYIEGGTPPSSNISNPGARGRTPPTESRPVTMRYELYFAGYSSWWKGASAFIREGSTDAATLGRMYLITDDQFNDVVCQENGRLPDGTRIVPPFSDLSTAGELLLEDNPLYGRLVRIGEEEGWPILTFTTAQSLVIGPPSEAYVKVIAAGLRETYPSMSAEIGAYLSRCPGIRGSGIPIDDWL